MDNLLIGFISALWLGILTSVSPCPLATNIAAISFIGKNVGQPKNVLLSGLIYTIGRTLAYIGVGILAVTSMLSMPAVSNFLQTYLSKLMGPLLIIVGMLLLELISFVMSGSTVGEKMQKFVEKNTFIGAGALGFVFALSFCPVSAALFFGSLIPIALKFNSKILIPSIYGIGTALPVFVFATIIAFSAQSVGKAYKKLASVEIWARRITGVIFILAGIYLTLKDIFNVI